MERILHYQLTENIFSSCEKLTIKGFLKSQGYSVQNMKILKQNPEGICLNGAPAFLNAPLTAGDELTIKITENESSENIVPIPLPLEILYEDEDLLVLNKPAGMPIHPSQNNHDNSLANALAWHYQKLGQPFVFRCINRLDRDTSGLTIVAKHMVSAGILGSYVANKSALSVTDSSIPAAGLTREYLAISKGEVIPPQGTIDVPLGRKPGSIIERCVDFENGEKAVTHYQVLSVKNGHSLLSLTLETGRTHQIRIHMKHLGFPLIGDYLYNPDMTLISRQALHSHRLRFQHPITHETMEFTAPLPADMQKVLS